MGVDELQAEPAGAYDAYAAGFADAVGARQAENVAAGIEAALMKRERTAGFEATGGHGKLGGQVGQ